MLCVLTPLHFAVFEAWLKRVLKSLDNLVDEVCSAISHNAACASSFLCYFWAQFSITCMAQAKGKNSDCVRLSLSELYHIFRVLYFTISEQKYSFLYYQVFTVPIQKWVWLLHIVQWLINICAAKICLKAWYLRKSMLHIFLIVPHHSLWVRGEHPTVLWAKADDRESAVDR